MPTGKAAIGEIVAKLEKAYPNATYALNWKTPWELLLGSILAAQSSDERVNKLTPSLFAKYKDVRAFAKADVDTLTAEIRSCGLAPQKAKGIVACAQMIVSRFGGEVPRKMEDLLELPRVQRKTANVVLNTAFKANEGIIVDLHVNRVTPRMGLSNHDDPVKIERDLMEIVPKKDWWWYGAAVILLGRDYCRPSAPLCGKCPLESVCEKKLGGVAPGEGDDKPAKGAGRPARKGKASLSDAADDGESVGNDDAPGSGPPAAVAERAEPAGSDASPGSARDDSDDAQPASAPPPAHTPAPRGDGMKLPSSWQAKIGHELNEPYFKELAAFIADERSKHEVFPPEDEVFTAFELCPFDKVKVVLLGQDPYHDNGQAHGLCFSVKRGVKPPPSLMNMFKELHTDLGLSIPKHGSLEAWAKQGVLMLNAVLTVRAHQPNSHKDKGWERFTDAVIKAVNARPDPVVFALWGGYAQKKGKIVDDKRHVVLKAAHPSPLSAKQFMGSKPFSAINNALKKAGKTPIDWKLPL